MPKFLVYQFDPTAPLPYQMIATLVDAASPKEAVETAAAQGQYQSNMPFTVAPATNTRTFNAVPQFTAQEQT